MTHHLYPFSDERSYFFDSMYDHNRLCHGSKTFFRQPNKDQVKLESMFTKIQVLRTSAVGIAWCRGPLCVVDVVRSYSKVTLMNAKYPYQLYSLKNPSQACKLSVKTVSGREPRLQ